MMIFTLNRLKLQTEDVITEEQVGFKAEVTTTEQRHLKNLFEKVSSTSGVQIVLKSHLTGY